MTEPASSPSATPGSTPTAAPATAPDSSATPSQPVVESPERLLAAHEALKAQHKAERARAAELETKLKAFEDAKLSDTERLTKRIAELERQHTDASRAQQERILRYEAQLAASKLAIVDPDAAVKLMDWSALEYDEAGQPTNIESVLKELVKQRPYLAATAAPAPQPSPTNPARQTPTGARTYTVSQLKDFGFYAANKADIQAAMREGRILNE